MLRRGFHGGGHVLVQRGLVVYDRHCAAAEDIGRTDENRIANLQRDIARIVAIWEDARNNFAGEGGPYLFGEFSIADAMFAPVAWRLHIYNVPLPPVAAAYRDTMLAHPAMIEWHEAALKETEAHAHYDCVAEEYGGPR